MAPKDHGGTDAPAITPESAEAAHTSRAAATPVSRFDRFMVCSLFQALVKDDGLILRFPDGSTEAVGNGAPSAGITFTDGQALRAIWRNPTLAAGELYMDGRLRIDNNDLDGFLEVCYGNYARGNGSFVLKALNWTRRLARRLYQFNPVGKAQRNVAHHYDLSDALYQTFLDPDRQYSCAYFRDEQIGLDQAQEDKKLHLLAKLRVAGHHEVLDIGSGWGGLGLYIAGRTGANVTGVTLSVEQQRIASQRASERGMADKARFELQDYRNVDRQFDRIVSVGMFEHVGVGHYREFFDKISELLKPDGIFVLHSIGSASGPNAGSPWLQKYIFPGGYTPALSEVLPHIERAGLYVCDIEILRLHYAQTLAHWRQRFTRHWDKVRELYDERFCRMWEFYLAGCEAAFRLGDQMVFQIQIAKRNDAMPVTRDYVAAFETDHYRTV